MENLAQKGLKGSHSNTHTHSRWQTASLISLSSASRISIEYHSVGRIPFYGDLWMISQYWLGDAQMTTFMYTYDGQVHRRANDVMWCDVMWCAIRYAMLCYAMLWYDMIWYDMIWHDMIVLLYILWYRIIIKRQLVIRHIMQSIVIRFLILDLFHCTLQMKCWFQLFLWIEYIKLCTCNR